ncbi:MAG TPA: AAA family ATPase [Acidimicrobiales bacterium]|nr:AAA family ATPase [Acidimicrobiales bacterium]
MKAELADNEKMVGVAASLTDEPGSTPAVEAHLLGRFVITAGGRSTGTWPRPTARRLCQLVLTSPRRRLSRDAACEALFPALSPEAAVGALYKALSLARSVLSELGPTSTRLLCADRGQIWADPDLDLEVDLDVHEQALRNALKVPPGPGRDVALEEALSTGGTPLADEAEADWAVRVRERVEYLRQEARLELARDRARGIGRARPEQVLEAWQNCFEADPADEEAASALMRLHTAQNRRPLALAVYERCRSGLASLGLKTSPSLDELRASVEGGGRSAGLAPLEPDLAARHLGDRRLVSAVFVELSAPSLGAGTDPEDLRELVGVALAEVISEVESFGGTVASVSGFGMSAFFGAPQSHEDDPERAVRSALRMIDALGRVPPGLGVTHGRPPEAAFSARVGVETGPAVVGPVGATMGYGALGAVVGDAAALQSVAKLGSVLVGSATRAATEGIFEWGPSEEVRGTSRPKALNATYVVGPRARPMAEAGRRRMAENAPLAGRGAELQVLTEAVRATFSGKGGAVVVVGEPGLGKTRLVSECRKYFMGWVGAASGRLPLWLEGRCASYASSTPYGAYQQLLCRFIGAPLEAGEAVLRAALEAAVHAIFGKSDDEVLPVLARMMGLPAGAGGGQVALMRPAELQHATFSAVRSVLARLLERGPTVLALEDLHWSDPTSLRLTAELGKLAAAGPLLLLATRRPEPDPGTSELQTELATGSSCHLEVLALAPIAKPAEQALVRSLLGGDVEGTVLEVVCQGVDGNPLFLEERLASLLDSGALARDGTGWHVSQGNAMPVPEALERLIRSRCDRLSPAAREAIVAASVLGQEAERSALGAVSELGAELDDALSELVSAGLLTEARREPEPLYRFRHALIQEATYNGLLRTQRRQLHARAAWELEARATDRLEEVAAVLGGHFAAAGEADRAVFYLEMAADHAARVFANEEAIASCRQALAVMHREAGPSSPGQPAVADDRTATAVDLSEKLASLLTVVDRFGEARAAALDGLARVYPGEALRAARLQYVLANIEFQDHNFDAALAACDAIDELIGPCGVDDDRERVDLWVHMQTAFEFSVHFCRDELERAAEVIESVRPLVEEVCSPEVVACFHLAQSRQHVRARRYRVDAQVLEEHRRSVAVTRALGPGTTTEPNESQRCLALSNLGTALTWHGDLVEAQEVHEQALASALRLGSPGARGRVLVDLAINALRRGDVEVVRELASQAEEAASAAGVLYHTAAAVALQAWVAWRDQRVGQALALSAQALELWESQPESYPFHCLALWPLAGAHLDAGQVEGAVGAARQLLEPSQLRLPDELEAAVQAACEAWDRAGHQLAGRLLGDAVKLARKLGYA